LDKSQEQLKLQRQQPKKMKRKNRKKVKKNSLNTKTLIFYKRPAKKVPIGSEAQSALPDRGRRMWIHPSGEIIEYSVSVEQADTKVGLAKQRTRKLSQVVSATKEKQPAQPQKSEAQSGPPNSRGRM
jgi:hypothetical protein